jgi:hypothetical protein
VINPSLESALGSDIGYKVQLAARLHGIAARFKV